MLVLTFGGESSSTVAELLGSGSFTLTLPFFAPNMDRSPVSTLTKPAMKIKLITGSG